MTEKNNSVISPESTSICGYRGGRISRRGLAKKDGDA